MTDITPKATRKHSYYFRIVIEGFTQDKNEVKRLKENLESEVWTQDTCISDLTFLEVPEHD